MKKKAFTLVELLAVIVILAVILVIAIPQIMNTIKTARLSSIKDSALLIAEQAEKDYLSQQVLNQDYTETSIQCTDVAKLNEDYESCLIVYDDSGNVTIALEGKTGGKFSNYGCIGTKDNMFCTDKKNENQLDTIEIYFDANGGEGTMSNQMIDNINGTNLNENIYTKEDKQFIWWNTKRDGSGITYNDKEEIKELNTLGIMILYAQWGEPGLYNTQTKTYKPWDELGINVDNGTITGVEDKKIFNGILIIPETITSIGNSAFSGTKLANVTIPESVTSIGNYVFEKTNLTSVTIPKSVTNIGYRAFQNCSNLSNVILEDGMKVLSIRDNIFANTKILSIVIPKTLTNLTGWSISGGSNITSLIVETGNPVYHSEGNAIIETATNKLIMGCNNTSIPNYVTSVGDYAFSYANITSIKIPSTIISIGKNAFINLANNSTIYVENENVKNLLNGKYTTSYTTIVVDPSKFE